MGSVSNIFDLVSGKEEDQLSSSFGFILKNNTKLLSDFLKHIDIGVINNADLRNIDIP